MNTELKKRIITSIGLLSLLTTMYFYSFIMIGALLIIAVIIWIEFYALISKIIRGNKFQDIFFRFIFKLTSLLYLFIFVGFIFFIELHYIDLKIYLLYSVLVAILSDIGGLVFGKTFKGKKLSKISPNKTYSGSLGAIIFSLLGIPAINLFQELFFNLVIIDFFIIKYFLFSILISIICQLGDIYISFLKRKLNLLNHKKINFL